MSLVIRVKVPIEMHYAVIPMGTSKVNSSPYFIYAGHLQPPNVCGLELKVVAAMVTIYTRLEMVAAVLLPITLLIADYLLKFFHYQSI